jgi:Zn-dependent peptidase ImmA (M78 family)/DNA-binding XRE family transcriptional regulator
MFQKISQKLVGYRVKAAREAADWTQDQLASALGLNDRQTISDIENGKRMLKSEEMLQLSDILGRDIEFFIDPFTVAGEAQFSWRAANDLSAEKLDNFELRAGQWIGLLRWLRESEQGKASPLKQSLRISSQSTYEDAIERAEELVNTFGLGKIPAERLIECIEQNLDIPVLFVDAVEGSNDNSISGATCHLEDLGVILVNRNESESRRFFDLAHELFHALTWDAMKPEHRESNSFEERGRTKRIEQLANNFAAGLLMPQSSLSQLIDKRKIADSAHLAEVAGELRVTTFALAYRLFNLKWIDEVTRNELCHQGQRASISGTPKRFSSSYVSMLHRAIDRGQLSARKVAKTMGMSLPQLSELFVEHSLSSPFEL